MRRSDRRALILDHCVDTMIEALAWAIRSAADVAEWLEVRNCPGFKRRSIVEAQTEGGE